MVELNCETDFVGRSPEFLELAHELALQIAAASPLYILEDDIPDQHWSANVKLQNTCQKEGSRKTHPQDVNLKKYKEETVLLNQPYIRYSSMTVQDLVNAQVVKMGEKVVIRRFVRWELGSESSIPAENE